MNYCMKKVRSGRGGYGVGRCQRKPAEGCDGYCKQHFPANVKAADDAKEARWKAEADESTRQRSMAANARKDELRKIEAFKQAKAAWAELSPYIADDQGFMTEADGSATCVSCGKVGSSIDAIQHKPDCFTAALQKMRRILEFEEA